MKISCDLQKNVAAIKKILDTDDVKYKEIKAGSNKGCLIFASDIADKEALGSLILRPLSALKGKTDEKTLYKILLSPETDFAVNIEDAAKQIADGHSALFIDGIEKAFVFGLKKYDKRAIAEPPTSTVIKGPREGFVESLAVNVSLMRRKLASPDLCFKYLTVGKFSATQVAVCYIKTVADTKLVETLTEKIRSINIDAILDSSYISKFLGEHKTSLFKQIGNTEKPDILAAKILEGRVAIIVDGSPIALTVPYLLVEDLQSPSDYYNSSYSATLARLIRVFAIFLSLYLPAFYVSAQLFHLQFIPLSFLLTIVNSIKGIPLSPSFEMFFTLLIFEILNEASVRMPRYVGMVVSIVGGLVLGETAVNAGIISAPALMIIALSGICLYTVPELEQTFSLIRLLLLVIGGSFGAFGLIVASAILLTYLVSFENYSTPLLAPFSPLVIKDLKDGVYKGFMIEQSIRPLSLKNANKRRLDK
ncbi:MAG: spore germination protein [Clostridia bacterium]|nr:spore germination protein [Clostridia bacterium]